MDWEAHGIVPVGRVYHMISNTLIALAAVLTATQSVCEYSKGFDSPRLHQKVPVSARDWGFLFFRQPIAAQWIPSSSPPFAVFLYHRPGREKKQEKYHIKDSDITRKVTRLAGSPPPFLDPTAPKNSRLWPRLLRCVYTPLCVDIRAASSWALTIRLWPGRTW